MSSINAVGAQPLAINPTRGVAEAAAAEQAQFRPPVPISSADRQQHSHANTSQQSAEDAREEAFAKLKVQLQNPDVDMREQASIGNSETGKSAAQEFRDYMALSPAQKIKLKLLNELGISKEEFEALPPAEKDKIERKIAEQMKKQTELESLASLNAHLQAPELSSKLVANLTATQGASQGSGDDHREKDFSA
ncbi:hypothetical protein [Pseudomonas donghuensis]|uniref:Uncharacterized protein n=1 Tax=Pseudomonas donghuensis TaxID=1163398 RepID=A0AAP0SKD8_9PSED|nr:hypothetical protein [Pseudomonas donghuensis]KDO00970.2 hypothetical protein BV82_0837 [Pseudomonas donghuensis]MCP6692113.1 hypothetical protein [Pseudomonas donghuensis]MDF9892409.1 hypothetical protein [Pseudomonas vranovensis]